LPLTNNGSNKEVNINSSSESEFSAICEHGLKTGGIHLVSVKGHGKTRLLFGMARSLRQKARVLIFDGSLAWLYGFDRIPTITIKERDIVAKKTETIDEIERYKIKNWELVKFALHNYKDILFRLKTRKPSKRGFFIRQVVNYLDAIQRKSREKTGDNEAKGYIAYFVEEAQNAFNSRSTTRLEAEEFLTVFNEGRNQKEAFFTASQRLNDFSKTIRTKQTYCIGKIPEEDKTPPIRRLQKKYGIDFSKLESRNWCFEGKTFESPNWKQNGKPYQINKQNKQEFIKQLTPSQESELWRKSIPKPKKKPSLWQRFKNWVLFPMGQIDPKNLENNQDQEEDETEEDTAFGVPIDMLEEDED